MGVVRRLSTSLAWPVGGPLLDLCESAEHHWLPLQALRHVFTNSANIFSKIGGGIRKGCGRTGRRGYARCGRGVVRRVELVVLSVRLVFPVTVLAISHSSSEMMSNGKVADGDWFERCGHCASLIRTAILRAQRRGGPQALSLSSRRHLCPLFQICVSDLQVQPFVARAPGSSGQLPVCATAQGVDLQPLCQRGPAEAVDERLHF